jgi:hypothetical protein
VYLEGQRYVTNNIRRMAENKITIALILGFTFLHLPLFPLSTSAVLQTSGVLDQQHSRAMNEYVRQSPDGRSHIVSKRMVVFICLEEAEYAR